jgi:hypothetical protein
MIKELIINYAECYNTVAVLFLIINSLIFMFLFVFYNLSCECGFSYQCVTYKNVSLHR